MCGFAGFIDTKSFSENILYRMTEVLNHRGPDDRGIWINKDIGIGFAHTRLAILDVSQAGKQPMESRSGRYVIIFNGEIYNHLELRKEVEYKNNLQKNNWVGYSDTETLLAAIETWGIEVTLKKLNGMFAFAIYDKKNQNLILARDRIGEKPLYYGWQNNTFLFASELKAIKEHPNFDNEINENIIPLYLKYNYIPEPYSIYKNIYKLKPGSFITILCNNKSKNIEEKDYWSLINNSYSNNISKITDREAINEFEILIQNSVSKQKLSDVPIGSFLSGGIDSSLITAIMQSQSRNPINTFTIGFNDKNYDESYYANKIAKYLGTNHNQWIVEPTDVFSMIPSLSEIYDEPFADSSQIPTYLVSKFAKKKVTVCLSGDAGDELFGGYNRYIWLSKIHSIPIYIRNILSFSINRLSPTIWNKILNSFNPITPKKFKINMPGDRLHKLGNLLKTSSYEDTYNNFISTWNNPKDVLINNKLLTGSESYWKDFDFIKDHKMRMMILDILNYLPNDILCKLDRAAMSNSLETRVPFLDINVINFSMNLPLNMKIRNNKGKWIVRKLLNKYVPKKLFDRPKMGFGIPIDNWLRHDLKEWASDLINQKNGINHDYFDRNTIKMMWNEHLSGKNNWQYHLWNILSFDSWYIKNKK